MRLPPCIASCAIPCSSERRTMTASTLPSILKSKPLATLLILGGLIVSCLSIYAVHKVIGKRKLAADLDRLVLGCQKVDLVTESGFHYQEYNDNQPFRWTGGAAKLIVPIDDKKPPHHMIVKF